MFVGHNLMSNVTRKDRKLQSTVANLISNSYEHQRSLKEKEKKPKVDCHILCRAISLCVNDLKVVSGLYIGLIHTCDTDAPDNQMTSMITCKHSWLVTPDGAILEAYAVGSISLKGGGPLLIPTKGEYSHFGAGHYLEMKVELDEATLHGKALALKEVLQYKAKKKPLK